MLFLEKKTFFCKLTSNPIPMTGLANMSFLCICGHVIQILPKENFVNSPVTWSLALSQYLEEVNSS